MLVLRRRKGEEIIVNERMRIVIVETGEGSCSLAFEAPASDRIRRAELPPFQDAIIQKTAVALQAER
jgi:carbon storage regulator CsrA